MKNEYAHFLKQYPNSTPLKFDEKKEYLPFKNIHGVYPEEFFQRYSRKTLKKIFSFPYVKKHFSNHNLGESDIFEFLKTDIIASQLTNTEMPVELLLQIIVDMGDH